MSARSVPIWALLPRSAPESHQLAWERAWERVAPPRAQLSLTQGPTSAQLVTRMLDFLVDDAEAPPELVIEVVSAHVTEGRGAPDGISARGALLLACLRRDLWRSSWFPAALVALQESERDLDTASMTALTRALLRQGRIPPELRPMVLAVAIIGRPHRSSEVLRELVPSILDAEDVDDDCRRALFRLLGRPGWFMVRPDRLEDHPDLDEGTRTSLKRIRPFNLLIETRCVAVIEEYLLHGHAGPTTRSLKSASRPPPPRPGPLRAAPETTGSTPKSPAPPATLKVPATTRAAASNAKAAAPPTGEPPSRPPRAQRKKRK